MIAIRQPQALKKISVSRGIFKDCFDNNRNECLPLNLTSHLHRFSNLLSTATSRSSLPPRPQVSTYSSENTLPTKICDRLAYICCLFSRNYLSLAKISLNRVQLVGKETNLIKTSSRNNTSNQTLSTVMSAKIISGKEVSEEIREKLAIKVKGLSVKPKLVIVQVRGREDSNVYIKMKIQFAESIGATAEHIKMSSESTQDEVAEKVKQLNQEPSVHGIITQLPFDCTTKIDSDMIVNLIDPKKDVDGLCVYNAGKLSHGVINSSSFKPCTPNGCMELIRKSGIKVEGSRSVVIGRSKIVGSPMAQLLLWNDSTVTICHSRTKNIEAVCREADILVAAAGRAKMVKASWLKPGAVVIDCGINVIPDSTRKSGTRLVGDVDFDECKEVAGAITPVPGGVGPMTVAMLIANTVEAAERATSAIS